MTHDKNRCVWDECPIRIKHANASKVRFDRSTPLWDQRKAQLCHRVEAVSLATVETIYKGKDSILRKDEGSLTEVPIAKDLSDDLTAWRQASQDQYDKKKHGLPPSGEKHSSFLTVTAPSWTRATTASGSCAKLATELGLPKLTFQVIRRTIATLAQKKGTVSAAMVK